MSYLGDKDFLLEVEKGNVANHSSIHKFGRNPAVGTSFVPISVIADYPTPQPASATTLRVKAGGDANDTAAGSGAREVTIIGLDETGAEVTEAVATAGASASSATTATYMRMYRAYVSASGTYATASAGSHAATIDIENGAGGTDWGTLTATDFARSQTQIGAYSVPLGTTAYLVNISVQADSTKSVDMLLFKRENILETAAPYTAMRLLGQFPGISGELHLPYRIPLQIPALTDVGFLGKVTAGTADVSVDMHFVLVTA